MLDCRDVSAVGELRVQVWDLGGTRNDKQLERLAAHPQEVMENSRFLGQVEVPLADTLVLQRGRVGMAAAPGLPERAAS